VKASEREDRSIDEMNASYLLLSGAYEYIKIKSIKSHSLRAVIIIIIIISNELD